MLKWRFAGATDTGKLREQNEDAFSIRHGVLGVFIVADGLGGHQSGEVASRMAVECLESELEKLVSDSQLSGMDSGRIEELLKEAMLQANATVLATAEKNPELGNMGCTLLASVIHGDHATIAHVGDVRAYLWHAGTLTQLTTDHTEVAGLVAQGLLTSEEARHYPFNNRLDRAVGLRRNLIVDVRSVPLSAGDQLLFCSDGLWNMLDDPQLSAILAEGGETEARVQRLVREANEAGGKDNITIILVDLLEEVETIGAASEST